MYTLTLSNSSKFFCFMIFPDVVAKKNSWKKLVGTEKNDLSRETFADAKEEKSM